MFKTLNQMLNCPLSLFTYFFFFNFLIYTLQYFMEGGEK